MRMLRAGVVCDFREEGWPSMDLVADTLLEGLALHAPGVHAVEIRPRLALPFTRLGSRGHNLDRAIGRYLAYPRHLRRSAGIDLFHVQDHSYAHLVHALPEGRTLVTCHDLDAFRSLIDPGAEPRPRWFRALSRHVLRGMQRASLVLCDSAAVAAELTAHGLVAPERLRVAPLPVHPDFRAGPDPAADARAQALLPGDAPIVLHVGSTAPRKRIDLVLEAFAWIRDAGPARLVRVGGPLPPAERMRAERLGVAPLELPFLERRVLAAVYRRAGVVLLPSDREGFGLPLLEAMACGAPVVASDLPVLREVGGAAARYVPAGDAAAVAAAALDLLAGGGDRAAGPARAADHSVAGYVERVVAAYHEVAGW
jgi:glycosyltransferase involved in cell wall biosynthesis